MRVSSLFEDWHHAAGSGSLLRSMLDNSCDFRHPAYAFRIGGLPNDFRANWAFLPHLHDHAIHSWTDSAPKLNHRTVSFRHV